MSLQDCYDLYEGTLSIRLLATEGNVRRILELAMEIKNEDLNFEAGESPSFIFIAVLQRLCVVEAEYFHSLPIKQTLGFREIELLEEWFSEMKECCNYTDEYQLLFDVASGKVKVRVD